MRSVLGTTLLFLAVSTLSGQATSSGPMCKTGRVVVGPGMEAAVRVKGAILLKQTRWARPHTSAIDVYYKTIRKLTTDDKGLVSLDGLSVGEYELRVSLPDGEAWGRIVIPKNAQRAECTRELFVWKTPRQLDIMPELCGPFSQTPCPCEGEIVQPNLRVDANSRVYGRTLDRSGAAVSNAKLEIRQLPNSSSAESLIASAQTGSEGAFDFGIIKLGLYRFVVDIRAWAPPSDLRCWEKSECLLNLTLEVNPTDLPFAHCPVK